MALAAEERPLTPLEKQVLITRLRHEEGMTWVQIGERVGLSHTTVREHYIRAVRSLMPVEEMVVARQAALDELDFLKREALRILRTEHPLVQWGKLVLQPNSEEPFLDDGPILQAMNSLLRIERQRASIIGYDAPKRHTVVAVTEEMVQAAIAQLEAEGITDDPDDDEVVEGEIVE